MPFSGKLVFRYQDAAHRWIRPKEEISVGFVADDKTVSLSAFKIDMKEDGYVVAPNALPIAYATNSPRYDFVLLPGSMDIVGAITRDGTVRFQAKGTDFAPIECGIYFVPALCHSTLRLPPVKCLIDACNSLLKSFQLDGFFDFTWTLEIWRQAKWTRKHCASGVSGIFGVAAVYNQVSSNNPLPNFYRIVHQSASNGVALDLGGDGCTGTQVSSFASIGYCPSVAQDPTSPSSIVVAQIFCRAPNLQAPRLSRTLRISISSDAGVSFKHVDKDCLRTCGCQRGEPIEVALAFAPNGGRLFMAVLRECSCISIYFSDDLGISFWCFSFVKGCWRCISISVGPSFVWVSASPRETDDSYCTSRPVLAIAIRWTDFNNIACFAAKREVPGSELGGQGNIAADSRDGAMVVGVSLVGEDCQSPAHGAETRESKIWFSYASATCPFRRPVFVASSNVGCSEFYSCNPRAPNNPSPCCVFDLNNRAYIAYLDRASYTGRCDYSEVWMIYSDDLEQWSEPIKMSLPTASNNERLEPSFALDRVTGTILLSWLDNRDSTQDNGKSAVYGAVILPTQFAALVPLPPTSCLLDPSCPGATR
jgi:hypothetical protein